jgi:hypothetical protein
LEYARQQLLMHHTESDYFVCIDNDCLPPPQAFARCWLQRMIELMQKYEDYAAISMRTPVMVGTGNIFEDETKELTDFPHPGGSFRIMRTDVVKAVGGWDREAPGRGSEERYICGKLRENEFKTAFSTYIQCLHLWGTRSTDNWGYPKDWKPEDTGHSPDVWHSVFDKGDDYEDVVRYSGTELADRYFNEKD